MQHLRSNGIGVPRVLPAAHGSTVLESGAWTYEVHEIPPGIDLYEDAISWTPFLCVDHARSAGAMLARMHRSAETYDAPPRPPRPLVASFTIFAADDPVLAVQQYLAARPVLQSDATTVQECTRALELLAPFHHQLNPLLLALQSLWTHNDLHASNLFWSDTTPHAHATSVIDFGLADRTNAVHDLAHAIERNIVDWLRLMNDPGAGHSIVIRLDQLWALLDGYEQVRRLSNEERLALGPMLALCHAEFALTEAHYFLEVLNSPEKARVATHNYLVKHAEWFSGPGTMKLLDPLQHWAEAENRKGART